MGIANAGDNDALLIDYDRLIEAELLDQCRNRVQGGIVDAQVTW
jgi:hypothetical protein